MIKIKSKKLIDNSSFEVYYESDRKLKSEEIDKLNDRLLENKLIKVNDTTLKTNISINNGDFIYTLIYFIESGGEVLVKLRRDEKVTNNNNNLIFCFVYYLTNMHKDEIEWKIYSNSKKISVKKMLGIKDEYELMISEENPFPIKLNQKEYLVRLDFCCCFDYISERLDTELIEIYSDIICNFHHF